ncbi:MAG: MaoC family dehydratase [Ferrimicrobium sp.]
MARVVNSLQELRSLVGSHLGYSDFHEITQDRIDRFADATDDHQWIHTDPERAASGPFGTTIAHGFLTLSMVPVLLPEVLAVEGVQMGINYGANRVRFPAPVPVGSKVRLGATLAVVEDIPGGVQVQLDVTIEVQGAVKPSLAAEILFRYYQ